jgi:hypothetical protein
MSAIYLGVIVAVTLIVVAWFYWKPAQGFRSKFTYLTPAAPCICEAVRDLFSSLRTVLSLSHSFEATAARTDFPSCVRGSVTGARQSAKLIASALAATEAQMRGVEPMYASYHAIYRGMCGSDELLLNAAKVYMDTGRAVHQSMVSGGALCDAGVADAGATLINMGKQLHAVMRAVHRLGVALDLE